MPSCELFALGHAIVDVEFSVSTDFLYDLGYTPGDRSVIDQARFQILHAALQAPGAGVTWRSQSGGGSAANSLVTAQRLGTQCHFAAKLAKDAAGWFYQQTLQQEGIQVPDTPLAPGISGHCLVLVTPDGERTMLLHLGVTENLDTSYVDLELLSRSRCLYLESYLVTAPLARKTVAEAQSAARKAQVPIAVSLSDAGIVSAFRDTLQDWFVPPVDYLFGNASEALAWTGADDLETALDQLSELATLVIITCGRDGAVLQSDQGRIRVPTPATQPVSTLGAGDTFAGAMLHGLVNEGWTPETAARFACECAARQITFSGARLDKAELMTVRNEFEHSSQP